MIPGRTRSSMYRSRQRLLLRNRRSASRASFWSVRAVPEVVCLPLVVLGECFEYLRVLRRRKMDNKDVLSNARLSKTQMHVSQEARYYKNLLNGEAACAKHLYRKQAVSQMVSNRDRLMSVSALEGSDRGSAPSKLHNVRRNGSAAVRPNLKALWNNFWSSSTPWSSLPETAIALVPYY